MRSEDNESSATPPARPTVHLRPTLESDLPIFFAYEQDPESSRIAAFPSREREAFMAHWARVLANPSNITRTILYDGQVAGNLGSWEQDGEREVGYWLGRQYWGRGIATQALAAFLQEIPTRPLYGYVAKHNIGSQRVLEKCGFTLYGEAKEFAEIDGRQIEGLIFKLTEES